MDKILFYFWLLTNKREYDCKQRSSWKSNGYIQIQHLQQIHWIKKEKRIWILFTTTTHSLYTGSEGMVKGKEGRKERKVVRKERQREGERKEEGRNNKLYKNTHSFLTDEDKDLMVAISQQHWDRNSLESKTKMFNWH